MQFTLFSFFYRRMFSLCTSDLVSLSAVLVWVFFFFSFSLLIFTEQKFSTFIFTFYVCSHTHAWRNSLWFIVLAVLCIRVELNRSVRHFKNDFCWVFLCQDSPKMHNSAGESDILFSPCYKSKYFSIKWRACVSVQVPDFVWCTSDIRRKHHTPRHIALAFMSCMQ